MELTIKTREVEWWFWAVTLAFMIFFALIGWIPSYYIVMAICGIQILYFTQKEGGLMVTFTGRCFIALVLKVMPWNKNLAPGASCEIGSVEK